jgi:hypothetical protein
MINIGLITIASNGKGHVTPDVAHIYPMILYIPRGRIINARQERSALLAYLYQTQNMNFTVS